MTANLLGFGVANYRSFGEDGFVLGEPKKLNIFIGKNNSGKSNALRIIQILSRLKSPKVALEVLRKPTDRYRRSAVMPVIIAKLPIELVIPDDDRNGGTVREMRNKFKHGIEIRWNSETGAIISVGQLETLPIGELRWLMKRITDRDFSQAPNTNRPYIEHIGPKLISIAVELLKNYGEAVSVPVFREIRKAEKRPIEAHDGINIIDQLRVMQHPPIGEDHQQDTFRLIQDFTRDLVGVADLELEVPPNDDVLIVNMHGNRLPLENYGTGIHHLVIMCSALAMYKDKVVTIEEPEVHLHPELQRKFLKFITDKTENIYYITTHSNVFIDALDDAAIYHVKYNGTSSAIHRVDSLALARNVLSDMGYKASDLLQANGVIWVEGPSDRIYLNKWLSFIDPTLVEGIHYAVAFYGGKVLAHFTVNDDPVDDLVQLLRINRHSVVMMDRDGDDETTKLSQAKARLQNELTDGFCWITEGREVENYLPPSLIDRYLKSRDATVGFRCGKDDRIDKALEAFTKPIIRYGREKVKYSREFVKLMENTDLDILDLRQKLEELVRHIHSWNQADVPAAAVVTN